MMNLDKLHKKIIGLEEKRKILQENLKKVSQENKTWYNRHNSAIKGVALIQKVAEETQNKITFYISDLVTSCIQSVPFKDTFSYDLEFHQKRNQTEGYLWFVAENGEKIKPIDTSGGGLCDITSLGNQIAFWCLKPNRELFFLDEPTKHLSKGLSEAAGEMLKTLVEEKEIQVIMVSHDKKLAELSHNVIHLNEED
jgi:DNA repair exonuclease SbcCD ATPase subunit